MVGEGQKRARKLPWMFLVAPFFSGRGCSLVFVIATHKCKDKSSSEWEGREMTDSCRGLVGLKKRGQRV